MANNGASGMVRVKLDLRCVVRHRGPHNLVWIIADRSETPTIGHFARLVQSKYGVPKSAELYLDDALLPHGEPIAMLNDKDTVRVVGAIKQQSSSSSLEPIANAEPSSVTDERIKTEIKQEDPGSSSSVHVACPIAIKLESSDSDPSDEGGMELSQVTPQPIKRKVKWQNPSSGGSIDVAAAVHIPPSDLDSYTGRRRSCLHTQPSDMPPAPASGSDMPPAPPAAPCVVYLTASTKEASVKLECQPLSRNGHDPQVPDAIRGTPRLP
nr:uncharacterized protein LOC119179820 [Rhipicephalus microplus]